MPRRSLLVAAVALASVPCTDARIGRAPVTAERLLALATAPPSTAVSPDGTRVLYRVLSTDVRANAIRQSLWAVDVHGGAPSRLLEVEARESLAPAWSPDGATVAVLLRRDGRVRLCLMRASGGAPAPVGDAPGNVTSLAWSPDGRHIAVTSAAPSPPDPGPWVASRATGAPERLFVVDLASGTTTAVTDGDLSASDLDWSPDGRRIAFSAGDDVYVVEPGSPPRAVVAQPGRDVQPKWSPDGRRIAFFSAGGRPIGPLALRTVDAAGGETREVAPGFDSWLSGYPSRFSAWDAEGTTIYFTAIIRMTHHLFAASTETGAVRQVTSGPKIFYGFSLAPAARTLAFFVSDPRMPGDVYVSPVGELAPKRLTELNPGVDELDLREPEAVQWTSRDGREIEGLLMTPVGYERGRRYPLVVLVEGTYGTFDLSFTSRIGSDNEAFFPYQQQTLASRGYAVLMPNPRGSWGYGAAFARLGVGDFGLGPCDDILSGVDAMVASGVADPARLAILGTGFDAYRAAFAITETSRFRAASVYDGVYDLAGWYGQMGYMSFQDRMIGGAPWQVPEVYARISPMAHAANLRTPTLILRTDTGPALEVQAEGLYAALRKNGVPAEYVYYKGGAYEIAEPRLRADVIERTLAWLDRWVLEPSH